MKYETIAIHGGERAEGVPGVNVPIELSTTFVQKGLHDYQDYQYSRGNNPTRHYTETLVAQLEDAKYALALYLGYLKKATMYYLVLMYMVVLTVIFLIYLKIEVLKVNW